MSITTFQVFLATASLHQGLLVDLCAEPGLISRAKLLTYMERHGISPADKDRLIERYCRTSILYEEADFEYSVNPVVAGMDRQGTFFNDVVHGKFVPRPRPLTITPPKEERADHLVLFDDLLLSRMEKDRRIEGWPGFVIREYAVYPSGERLKAIALPLIMANPPFSVRMSDRTFSGDLTEFTVELTDFDIVWEGAHGR